MRIPHFAVVYALKLAIFKLCFLKEKKTLKEKKRQAQKPKAWQFSESQEVKAEDT